MSDITLPEILEKLSESVPEETAKVLLAVALDHLDMPVQDTYTDIEVTAIGTTIIELQRSMLANSEFAEARNLEEAIAPFVEGLKQDLFEPAES